MFLSVIIPTFNRNELLGKCLDRLAPGAQTLPSEKYEVIVTDDSTGEGAETFCQQHYAWVRYTRGAQKGPAANRNNGAKLAKGNWLVFTDDDCLPDAGWLQAYANAIRQYPNCKAIEGAILPDNWDLLKKDLAECPVNTAGGCFWSANIMLEKGLFEKLNGFDEQFKVAAQEDRDLKDRVSSFTTIKFVKDAQVIHPVRIIEFKKKFQQTPAHWENWMKYLKKQPATIRKALIKRSVVNHMVSIVNHTKGFHFHSVLLHTYALLQYFRLAYYRFK